MKERAMRRKLLVIPLVAVLLGIGQAAPVSALPSVQANTERVPLNGKTFQVKTVRIDLTDPLLQLDPVTAADGIGYDETFESMLNRTGAVAGINGTFFNAYEKDPGTRYPNGLLVQSGRTVHSGDNQSLILMADKIPVIRQVSLGIRVTFVQGKQTSTYFPWGINKYYGDDQTDQVVWYTPAMGRSIDYPNGTRIVIRENVVTEITQNPVEVPGDGFVFFAGNSENNKKNLLPRIQVGDKVDLESVAKDTVSGQSIDPGQWLSAIGVGPKLVTGGAVDIDYARDGFTDPKIVTQANRRSFVGIDGQNQLVMGTVDGATLREAADVILSMGITDAMNMDGGASSALYADGQMLTAPGRKLSNALVVRYLTEPRTQMEINGAFVPGFQGFIRNDTTLVPIRPLLVALNAEFKWNEAAGNLTVQKNGETLLLNPGDVNVMVNGKAKKLDTAPTLMDGHLYVPVRFVVETLGGKVEWNQQLYRVSLELGN
jgi:exopolysaccharide biosynthesis protein